MTTLIIGLALVPVIGVPMLVWLSMIMSEPEWPPRRSDER